MKTTFTWSTAICCLSLLLASSAVAETERDGKPIDPNCEYADGPCTCYCPMVKYKPRYTCEKKCYTEAYQVPRTCTRYVPQYYTKTYCRQVPEYYTKTHCRQVPEQYTVCDTKYRTKYYTVTHCDYVPCKYVVKKCGVCPTDCAPSCPSSCDNGGCSVARPASASDK